LSDVFKLDGVYALVLAGSRASGDPLCAAHQVETKALIPVGGEPMLTRVLRALSQSGQLRQAPFVSGLSETSFNQARSGMPAILTASVTGGPASSVLGVLESSAPSPLLVTTCDHALLTPEMIQYFVREAIQSGDDLSIGFASKTTIQGRYPETRRTYLPFGGEPMSGCNLFFIASAEALKVIQFWKQAEQDRKKPWRIALRFGPLTALRLLLGRPAAAQAFAILSKRLGARIAPIMMPFAEAAIDIDTPADLALVETILAARGTH
jgi:molybdopterin-guanine dinucleotide biosynthesis protein A